MAVSVWPGGRRPVPALGPGAREQARCLPINRIRWTRLVPVCDLKPSSAEGCCTLGTTRTRPVKGLQACVVLCAGSKTHWLNRMTAYIRGPFALSTTLPIQIGRDCSDGRNGLGRPREISSLVDQANVLCRFLTQMPNPLGLRAGISSRIGASRRGTAQGAAQAGQATHRKDATPPL